MAPGVVLLGVFQTCHIIIIIIIIVLHIHRHLKTALITRISGRILGDFDQSNSFSDIGVHSAKMCWDFV
jgi:hypothetical protein